MSFKYLFLLLYLGSFSSVAQNKCAIDSRTLTERIFNHEAGIIISCKILSYQVDKSEAKNIVLDSITISKINYLGIPAISKAKITSIYFGNIDTTILTFLTNDELEVGEDYLIYTASSGKTLNCGGPCDLWTKKIDNLSPTIVNEIKLLQQFSEIKNLKKSGKYVFENNKKQVIAQGKFKNGEAVGIWKHYYSNGKIKSIYDLKKKELSNFSNENEPKLLSVHKF